jgi:hypothetical protein
MKVKTEVTLRLAAYRQSVLGVKLLETQHQKYFVSN